MENVLKTLVLANYEIVFLVNYRTKQYRKILAKPVAGTRYPDSGVIGDTPFRSYIRNIYPEDRVRLRKEISPERVACPAENGKRKRIFYRFHVSGGRTLYRTAVLVPHPNGIEHICAIHDETEEMLTRLENDRSLRLQDEGIRFIVENMCENFIIADMKTRQCTTYTNGAGNVVCKGDFDEQIDWFAKNMVVPKERKAYREYFDMDALVKRIAAEGGICRTTCTVQYKNGLHTFAITSTVIDDPQRETASSFLFLCAQDITSIKRMKETNRLLLFGNQHDKLTGLFNRFAAEKMIRRYLDTASADSVNTFIFLDIDRFKDINDRYGHLTGDAVLRFMGDSMRKVFRSDDILCRWGGDEFVVFVKDFADEKVLTSRLNVLREKMGAFIHQDIPLSISLSVGGVCASPEITLNRLYELADEALYDVKNHGRNGISFRRLS